MADYPVRGAAPWDVLLKAYLDEQFAGRASDAELAAETARATTAEGTKASTAALTAHTGDTANPHATTKAQVGLGNADNTSDANKPVSTAQAAADTAVGTAAATDAQTKADAAQAYAIDRSHHIGSQVSTTISDLVEAVQDIVGAMLAEGTGVTLTYDDAGAGTVTIGATGGGGADAETIRDAIGVALLGVGVITVTPNDGADTITISSVATQNSTDAALRDRDTHTGVQAASTISDFSTAADARVAAAVGVTVEAHDADLTIIAGLAPSNDDIIQRKAGAWANRTPAQVKADLALAKGDVGLGNVDNTSDATKNTAVATLTNKTLTSPVINTPTGIVKGDVGLGNVDNTSDATKNAAAVTLTNKTLTAPVVNSPTGIVKGDVGLGNVDNTSDATKATTERAAVATLTNKTLTSPVINTPTGIVKGDVGLGNVDNTSNATERAAVATLTNKTLTSPVINTPTGIVKGDVGLGNVDNTSDASKATTERAATATLTNKRITKRVDTTASTATYTFDSDSFDAAKITAQAAALTIANPTGTPTAMQAWMLRIKDNGTARALTFGSQFRAIGVTLPTTTVISKTMYLAFIWNSDDTKWDVVSVAQEA